jgi:hypothetical protein
MAVYSRPNKKIVQLEAFVFDYLHVLIIVAELANIYFFLSLFTLITGNIRYVYDMRKTLPTDSSICPNA